MYKYFQAPWSLKDIIIVLIVAISSLIIVDLGLFYSGATEYLIGLGGKEFVILGLFLLQSIILLVPLVVIVLKKHKKWNWKDFGFGKFKIFENFGLAVLGYLFYLGITFVMSMLVVFGGVKIPGYQIPEPTLPLFGETNLAMMIAAVVIIGIAPILEEVFFRGFLLQGLVNRIGTYLGAILTAFVFALIHLQFESFIPIFILSLILSLLFIRSRSIWPCIWFHVINNGIAFAVELMLVRGVIPLDF
jgi:uncharacterized protein